ncbi:hypothetical protein L218DRAFT_940162 [Marasmius fiardii PR-910]|nr:hypothetical protein L218DRAFT_940162 [Marasmius fiardii PR-910]
MAFVGTSQFSIKGGAYNYVEGDQINNHMTQVVQQRVKKRTIYDEVCKIQDIDCKAYLMSWNPESGNYEVEFRAERTISVAEIHGVSSRFTVASYKGEDAEKASSDHFFYKNTVIDRKEEFQQFSETTDTTKMQLFGINRSSIPLLIFYGDLAPLAHFWDTLGGFGRAFASTLALKMRCAGSEIWVNPKQGTLIRGLEGPDRYLNHLGIWNIDTLPSTIKLLEKDVCIRYFSQLQSIKKFDKDIIDVLHYQSAVIEDLPSAAIRPCILSSLPNVMIAVGIGAWRGFGCLDYGSRVVMPDGRTQYSLFKKSTKIQVFELYSDQYDDRSAWFSQASSVFHELGTSLEEDLSSYKLILPDIWLRGTFKHPKIKQQWRSEGPPIHLFIYPLPFPPPLKAGSVVTTHIWSSDEIGQVTFSHDRCEYLGLPTKLWGKRLSTTNKSSWPSETYKSIDNWQTARGFDPTTPNFTRYLGYPEWKVLSFKSGRFEELNTGRFLCSVRLLVLQLFLKTHARMIKVNYSTSILEFLFWSHSSSQFLSPTKSTIKKAPSRHSLNNKRSTSSLHGPSSLSHSMDEDAAGNGRFSLAHELAVALMPEPSAGSKLLAEEFGIEYDEGAEGIDEDGVHEQGEETNSTIPSFADELSTMDSVGEASFNGILDQNQEPIGIDPVFASPSSMKATKEAHQDPMEVLAQDLESTDKFLSHLRHIDSDPGSSTLQQPAIEKIASDVIRRLNDTARDREGQVRELLEYEREFRKIAGEVGGNDVLGQLEELKEMKDVLNENDEEESYKSVHSRSHSQSTPVASLSRHHSRMGSTEEWNTETNNLDDDAEDDDTYESAPTPIKDTFPPPPPLKGPPSPASTIPQLAYLRSINTSLVTTLSTLSEHAQVNGAATTEAGRKIRALKNKIGTWRTDWDSAERSRSKIERWEAGILDGLDSTDASPSHTPSGYKRVDGRTIVQEHLQAFERALADAGMKTKAIMASG